MKELFKTLLKVIIVFIIVGTIINDLGIVIITSYYSKDTADTIAQTYAKTYNKTSSGVASKYKTELTAEEYDVIITNFDRQPSEVSVTIEVPVKRTIYLSRIEPLKKFTIVSVTGTSALNKEED